MCIRDRYYAIERYLILMARPLVHKAGVVITVHSGLTRFDEYLDFQEVVLLT